MQSIELCLLCVDRQSASCDPYGPTHLDRKLTVQPVLPHSYIRFTFKRALNLLCSSVASINNTESKPKPKQRVTLSSVRPKRHEILRCSSLNFLSLSPATGRQALVSALVAPGSDVEADLEGLTEAEEQSRSCFGGFSQSGNSGLHLGIRRFRIHMYLNRPPIGAVTRPRPRSRTTKCSTGT